MSTSTTADLKSASPALRFPSTARRVRGVLPQHVSRSNHFDVVHFAAECWPFARTGGLGEAVAGLAACQAVRGIGVTVVMPLYRTIRESAMELHAVGTPFRVPMRLTEVGCHPEGAGYPPKAGA